MFELLRNTYISFVGEILSAGLVIGALAHVLPSIGTILAIVWYCAMLSDRRQAKRRKEAQALIAVAAETATHVLTVAAETAAQVKRDGCPPKENQNS